MFAGLLGAAPTESDKEKLNHLKQQLLTRFQAIWDQFSAEDIIYLLFMPVDEGSETGGPPVHVLKICASLGEEWTTQHGVLRALLRFMSASSAISDSPLELLMPVLRYLKTRTIFFLSFFFFFWFSIFGFLFVNSFFPSSLSNLLFYFSPFVC